MEPKAALAKDSRSVAALLVAVRTVKRIDRICFRSSAYRVPSVNAALFLVMNPRFVKFYLDLMTLPSSRVFYSFQFSLFLSDNLGFFRQISVYQGVYRTDALKKH